MIRDRSGSHWLLGLFLAAGGLLGVAAPLGLLRDYQRLHPWERAASIAIGVGLIAGALWWLRRSPATRLTIDPGRRSLRIVRLGLHGREVQDLRLDEIGGVTIEHSEDSDGDPVTRPVAHLRSGAVLPLSMLWSHDHGAVAAAAEELARICGLPGPIPPERW
jgi:hypothetical protein